MKFFVCLAALFLSVASTAQAASINGEALRFEWVFGDDLDSISNLPESGNYTVGTDVQTIFFGDIRIGVSNNQVRLEWIGDSEFNNSFAYNGLKLTDAFGFVPDFLVFQQANGFGVSNVETEFDADTLVMNFANSGDVLAGSSALFEFRLSDIPPTVPLPASLPLLLAGAAGFCALRRKTSG